MSQLLGLHREIPVFHGHPKEKKQRYHELSVQNLGIVCMRALKIINELYIKWNSLALVRKWAQNPGVGGGGGLSWQVLA